MVLCKGPFYSEPTNSGVYTHFQSCLQSTVYNLLSLVLPTVYLTDTSGYAQVGLN